MYNLTINLLDGRSFTVDCKTRNNVAINAALIQNNGFVDADNNQYRPSEILSTVCVQLLTNNTKNEKSTEKFNRV